MRAKKQGYLKHINARACERHNQPMGSSVCCHIYRDNRGSSLRLSHALCCLDCYCKASGAEWCTAMLLPAPCAHPSTLTTHTHTETHAQMPTLTYQAHSIPSLQYTHIKPPNTYKHIWTPSCTHPAQCMLWPSFLSVVIHIKLIIAISECINIANVQYRERNKQLDDNAGLIPRLNKAIRTR